MEKKSFGSHILEALVKLHVQRELAVLAPVDGLGARAGLDLVGREGRLEERAGGIDLDVGRAGGAAAAEQADAVDLDLAGLVDGSRLRGGNGGGKADEGGGESEEAHIGGCERECFVVMEERSCEDLRRRSDCSVPVVLWLGSVDEWESPEETAGERSQFIESFNCQHAKGRIDFVAKCSLARTAEPL